MIKVGFVGLGRMGSALVNGSVAASVIPSSHIRAFDPDPEAKKRAKALRIRWCSTLKELVRDSQFFFLCVKPQQMENVLREIRSHLTEKDAAKKCFVTIAAGIPLSRLRKELGSKVSLFRVMPNTPGLLGAGMSAISRGPNATPKQEKFVMGILKAVGDVVTVPESLMDAVTAVSGSGPAYIFYLAEAMIRGAASLGMGPALARRLVHQTIYGAGLMLRNRPEPAEELRRQVTSPGGTTAAAIEKFESSGLKSIVEKAVLQAARRSVELSKI